MGTLDTFLKLNIIYFVDFLSNYSVKVCIIIGSFFFFSVLDFF